ncbi:cuticle protein 6-like [Periplaneta americana]|uniref:cuticle protein 6-like n=1 Tax=Periplaneta americana TaxID=6978 RepID=UPI0037E73E6B
MCDFLQIVIFGLVISAAQARPGYLPGHSYSYFTPASLSSQYHTQDGLGQYSYGYTGALSSKNEAKTFDGVTRGGYSYVDSNGIVQSAAYTADAANGFKVSATNLPVAPKAPAVVEPATVQDTPEVAAAKEAHKAAYDAAAAAAAAPDVVPVLYPALAHVVSAPGVVSSYQGHGGFAYSTNGYYAPHFPTVLPVPPLVGGVPADTPEVAAAKAAHFAAHVQARYQNWV